MVSPPPAFTKLVPQGQTLFVPYAAT